MSDGLKELKQLNGLKNASKRPPALCNDLTLLTLLTIQPTMIVLRDHL